ncbi:MAG: 3-oxoadipate enol-lactonase [Gammaproteobacteria bacterium]
MPHAHINGADIHYQWDQAQGATRATDPVVLLSNSLSSTLSMWDKQVPALLEHGYRVLRYDSRGHGASTAPDEPYSIGMLANDAIGLIDSLEITKVHFCGLSMGGMVGQFLASHFPERLISATLCATAAHLNLPGVWDERRELVLNKGMSAVVEPTLSRWFSPAAAEHIPAELEAIRAGILLTPPAGYANSCLAIRDMDQRSSIKSVDLPVLVIAGENDPSTTVANAEEIANSIKGARLAVIKNAQHLLNIEMAAEFNEILIQFLQDHTQ